MSYLVSLCVRYRQEVFDPQSLAVEKGIRENLGFSIEDFVLGKYCRYTSHQKTKADAAKEAEELCSQLLSNPVIETYQILSIAPSK